MDSRDNKKNSNSIFKVLLGVFLAGFLVCIGVFIGKQVIKHSAKQEMDDMADSTTGQLAEVDHTTEIETNPSSVGGVEIPEKNLNWAEIQTENPDIYAWIYIPGTAVDYPILQHPEDNSYYLNHNVDGSAGYPGCIYTENYNTTTFNDKNTVIYGHDMKDGSMFATLHNYRDSEFFEENSYIFIYMPNETYVYEIYTACEFGDEHLHYAYNFDDTESYGQFISDVANVRAMDAQVRRDISVTAEDRMITLSTCIASKPNNRYLVTAVQIHD